MKKFAVAIACTSILAAASAYADLPDNPVAGIILGASAGMSKLQSGTKSQTRTISSINYTFNNKKNRFAGELYLGNLWGINRMFSGGVQLGVTYWGEYQYKGTSSTSGEADYTQMTFDLLFLGQMNFSQDFYGQIMFGPAFNVSQASGSLTNGTKQNASVHHKAVPEIGLKLGFSVTPDFSFFLVGKHLMADSGTSAYEGMSQRLVKSSYVGLGFNYNLGQ